MGGIARPAGFLVSCFLIDFVNLQAAPDRRFSTGVDHFGFVQALTTSMVPSRKSSRFLPVKSA
jgi:hypothetical protein